MKVCQCLFTTAIVVTQVLSIYVYYTSRNENFYQDVIETGKEGRCTFEFDQDKGILCYYQSYRNDYFCKCPAIFMFDNKTRLDNGYNEYIVRVETYKLTEIVPITTYEYISLDITKAMGADQANKICAVQECSVDPQSVYDGKDQCSLHLDDFSTMSNCLSPPCEVSPKKSFTCTHVYYYIFSYSIDEMKDYMDPFPSYLIESGVNFFIILSILFVMVQYCISQCCCDKEMIITVK